MVVGHSPPCCACFAADQGDLEEYQLLEGDEEEGDGVRGGLAGLDGYVTEQGGYSTEEGGYATDELAGQSEEEED